MNTRSSVRDVNPLNSLFSVLILIAVFTGLFFAFKFIFEILWKISPVIILVTLLFDYQVILKYFRLMGAFLRKNLIAGILFISLSVLFLPVVAIFLMAKAILNRKMKKMQADSIAENQYYTHYEEIDDEPIINQSRKEQNDKYDYSRLFEN
jgi:hypothetical protein